MQTTWADRGLLLAALVAVTAGCGRSPHAPRFDEAPSPERYGYLWDRAGDPYLAELRRVSEPAVPPEAAGDDLATLVALTRWVHDRWEYDGNNAADPGDALAILQAAEGGERFGYVEYAHVLTGCLAARGIQARETWLMTADVETRESDAGHLVVEAWLPEQQVWAMSDPRSGVVPTLDGDPLTAVALMRAITSGESEVELLGVATEATGYLKWIRPYLYHFAFVTECRANPEVRGGGGVMLVPLGVEPPTVFQRDTPIQGAFTRSLTAFYAHPNVAPPATGEMIRRAHAPVRESSGYVFSIYYPGAAEVFLTGGFNDWDPEATPMADADGDGVWVAMVDLPPGRHEYKFVADGALWIEDPNGSGFVGDGHEGRNSVLVVE